MTLHRQVISNAVILIYLVLLFFYVPLRSPFLAADLLAPAVAVLLLQRRNLLTLHAMPYRALLAFLACATFATACHLMGAGGENGYNLAVFAYLAALFVFVRENPLPRPLLLRYGSAFCALILLAWLAEQAAFMINGSGLGFSYLSAQMDGTAMSFLARRFAFRFQNPNTLGSFYVLPLAMLLQGLTPRAQRFTVRQHCLCSAGLALCCIPLLHSFSKHALLSMALIMGFLADSCRPRRPKLSRWAWLPVLAAAIVCTATVFWVVFPLQAQWPFINRTSGMYMIHQSVYAKIAVHSPRGFLVGHGPGELHSLYPQFANQDAIDKTLVHYNALDARDSFAAFMDPHQEYLNILCLFGAAALLAMIAFWGSCAAKNSSSMARYFLLALAFCCLWDDLLSKRWLWLAAAIVLRPEQEREEQQAPPTFFSR